MGINHTPGPWIVYGAPGNVWAPFDRANVANAYIADRDRETRSANARLIAEAPAMLAALRDAMEELQAWRSKYHPIQWPDKPVVHTATRDKIRAILSRIDGAPTAQPSAPSGEAARDMPISEATRAALVGYAEDSDMWNAPSPEMVAQLLDLAGIERRPPSNVFTAFCQEADGTGTIWIQQVKAETIADATAAARRDCAEDWGFDVEQVHCLGLARGDCQIVHWSDLCDGGEG